MKHDPISELRRYAEHLVEDVDPGHARSVVAAAMSRVSPGTARPGWVRRTATTTAALVTLAGGNVGLAVASSGSVPGDSLYPVERFYEGVQQQLGIREDFSGERLREAQVLAERGQLPLALQVAQEGLQGLPELTSPELTTALAQATEELTRAEEETDALQDAPGYQLTDDLRNQARSFLDLARSAAEPQADDIESPAQMAQLLVDQARSLAAAIHQTRQTGGANDTGTSNAPIDVPAGGEGGPPSSLPTPSGTPTP